MNYNFKPKKDLKQFSVHLESNAELMEIKQFAFLNNCSVSAFVRGLIESYKEEKAAINHKIMAKNEMGE